ncbi:MAG: DAK2 domain-containing protein [Candidatus Eremiobacteraeota bacterium]|nr:DAK2 domain-containing protein [Candidatus Eremiobacteraeota bacterium]
MEIVQCDSELFRKLFLGGVQWVACHREHLNRLNVYPVPDGDTGTNMYLTLRGAVSAFRLAGDGSLGSFLAAIAKGALLGARGNSGVILSQILGGFGKYFKGQDFLTAGDLAPAFRSAADRAYKAVSDPKEGTILTVIRVLAEELENRRFAREELLPALEQVHQIARHALVESRDLLPILKESQVLDAGGQGFVYLLEGMLRAARFENHERMKKDRMASEIRTGFRMEDLEYRYCTEFIVETQEESFEELTEALEGLGNSLAVASSPGFLKIHLHTNAPDTVRGLVASAGAIIREKRDDMLRQHKKMFLMDEMNAHRDMISPRFESLRTALAAIVTGSGLIDVFESAGAYVINGGRTMNPSVKEVVEVLERIPSRDILLLPNNANCISCCEIAAGMLDRTVLVLPVKDLVQGLAFLDFYDPSMGIDDLKACHEEHKDLCLSVEIFRARQERTIGATIINQGDWVAMAEGEPLVIEGNIRRLLAGIAAHRITGTREKLTVVTGADAIPGIDDITGLVKDLFPLETTIIYGGHPTFPLLLGLY